MGARPPSYKACRRSFVYDQALIISCPPLDLTLESLPFYRAVVMFNMGLTFHLSAANGHQVDKTSLLYDACFFYEQGISHLMKGVGYCQNPTLLLATLLNNLAEVHFQLGKYATCEYFISSLWFVMTNQNLAPNMDECERDGVLYNILGLPKSLIHASAA